MILPLRRRHELVGRLGRWCAHFTRLRRTRLGHKIDVHVWWRRFGEEFIGLFRQALYEPPVKFKKNFRIAISDRIWIRANIRLQHISGCLKYLVGRGFAFVLHLV